MNIQILKTDQNKQEIVDNILHALPKWFGIESAIQDYINDTEAMAFWIAFDNDQPIGFAAVNIHFPNAAEIHVMGVLKEYHRNGIGRMLVEELELWLKTEGVEFLQVKTLSPSRESKEYELTRKFYLSLGFTPVEEFPTIWGEANPALMLIKKL